jgi:hypothetical protein
MDFWKKNGYSFHDVLSIPEDSLLLLLNSMDRQDIIQWLAWNDPNGVYRDEQSLKELGNIMSREEGLEIMLRHIEENRVIKNN